MKTTEWPAGRSDELPETASFFASLHELTTEEHCIRHLEQVRWPDGLRCIREGCGSPRIMTFDSKGKTGKVRHLYECVDCRYQYSVTTGTIFHNSHLPLSKWFLAIHLLCSARRGISIKELERKLKINYRTAEYVLHRIRLTMRQGEQ